MAKMIKAKYVRIQGRDLAYKTGKCVGVFSSGWRLIRSNIMNESEEKLFRSIDDWFKQHLPEPPFYQDDNPDRAITFFKTDTTEFMIEKLYPIMKIFDKYEYKYDIVYTNYVDKIIYEDEFQIAVVDK